MTQELALAGTSHRIAQPGHLAVGMVAVLPAVQIARSPFGRHVATATV